MGLDAVSATIAWALIMVPRLVVVPMRKVVPVLIVVSSRSIVGALRSVKFVHVVHDALIDVVVNAVVEKSA
jgi:hypothetical protein